MQLRGFALWAMAFVAASAFGATHEAAAYPFAFSSLAREGAVSLSGITATEVSTPFTLGEAAFDKSIDFSGDNPIGSGPRSERPIAYVPNGLTVTGLSVAFPQGTDAPGTLTLTVGGADYTLTLQGAAEETSLHDANGGRYQALVRDYALAEGPVLATSETAFSIGFSYEDIPGDVQNRNLYCLDGKPFLRVRGTAEITHYVFEVSDGVNAETHGQTLSSLLAKHADFVDDPNHVVVVEFTGAGGGVKIDRALHALQKAPLIFGSAVPAAQAHLHFDGTDGTPIRAPMTFRDGATTGGVSLYGPSYAETSALSVWDPKALLVLCDVTLRSPLPYDVDQPGVGWFQNNTITIPARRTFRLELPAGTSENQLPKLAFEDATSILELASANDAAGIPTKYYQALCAQSGTLVIDRDFSAGALIFWGLGAERLSVVLRPGHTYAIDGAFGVSDYAEASLTVEGGTLKVSSLNLAASAATLDILAGAAVEADSLTGIDAGTLTTVTVAQGATLTLKGELAAGSDAGDGVLDLTVAGKLNLGGNLNMIPARRRTLALAGGAIVAQSVVKVDCGDGSEGENFLAVRGGGTIEGPITVTGVTGQGTLKLGAQATLSRVHDYVGTIEGEGAITRISGDLGDVTLGDDWHGKLATLIFDVADGYHGTLGFTAGAAGAQKAIDFSAVNDLLTLPGAFRVNNHQHVTIRLDQFADATFRWPENPTDITLTLIESGAYGGELTIPAIPAGVTLQFASFGEDGAYALRPAEDFTLTPAEDGVTAELTWENPVFTGKGAWIDVEFNGSTANTGWFTLGDYDGKVPTDADGLRRFNGLLGGDNIRTEGEKDIYEVLYDGTAVANWGEGYTVRFSEASFPAQTKGCLPLWYRPFVALGSLEYPEAWTISARMSAPDAPRTCILALGHNYGGEDVPAYDGETYALVFATGESANEICLWVFPGLGDAANAAPAAPAFRVTMADATSALHTFSVISDGATLSLYVDGARLGDYTLPTTGSRLANGLQVGVQMGSSLIPAALAPLAAKAEQAHGGAIDFIRFYKGAMPESAMAEIADSAPYIRKNLRYLRTVAADGTWIQAGAWQAQTWDGAKWVDSGAPVDQPAEGAECRLLVAPGEYALQVNVKEDEANHFYAAGRTYAALTLAPTAGSDADGTLRLVPAGVTAKETEDGWEQDVIQSDWFNDPAYGTLRFTGGLGDPLNDEDPTFSGAGALLPNADRNATITSSTTWQDEDEVTLHEEKRSVVWGTGSASGWYEQTGTRTTTTAWDNRSAAAPVNLIVDAGVCAFSKRAEMVLRANAGRLTLIEDLHRTGDYKQSFIAGNESSRSLTPDLASETVTQTTKEWDEEAFGDQLNTLTLVAGRALTRGENAEVARWQLTGPVTVEGTPTLPDHVLGHPTPATDADQASDDVWVPTFDAETSAWKFYDDTASLADGLFARGVQTPGRLYLDLTQDPVAKDGAFSKQAWYRYGYHGTAAAATDAGMEPVPVLEGDYGQAVAFQIRLAQDATLDIDALPTAESVQTFYVEKAAGAEVTPKLTLTISTQDSEGNPYLRVEGSVIVAGAALDVSNGLTGNKTNVNTLRVTRRDGTRASIHKGSQEGGVYITGPAIISWDFGAENSIPRLEVAQNAELTFTAGQNLRDAGNGAGIVVAAQQGAWIHHATGAPFLGTDVELGQGAVFGFHAESESGAEGTGVVLSGALRLAGTAATLRAEHAADAAAGSVPHFTAAGGIVAEQAAPTTLTLHADAAEGLWHLHTVDLRGEALGLKKDGPGTVVCYAATPPTVTGPVTVAEGELQVSSSATTPVGAKGLHVAVGATLADTGLNVGTAEGSHRLANLGAGATLSGGGTVEGWLGLASGATLKAAAGQALIVTEGLALDASREADIVVDLAGYTQGGTQAAQPYLVVNREERDARARLRPTTAEGARWDSVAWIEGDKTSFAARQPQVPVPRDYEGYEDDAGNVISAVISGPLINQYQSAGHAYVGATHGRTRGGEPLNGSEMSEALLCFSNISAFVPSEDAVGEREYVDGTNIYVAYEFGIAGLTLVEAAGEPCVVAEIAVESTLEEAFPDVTFNDTQKHFVADFNDGTVISLKRLDAAGAEHDLPAEVAVTEVAAEDARAGKPGRRWLRVPYAALADLCGEDGVIRLRASVRSTYADAAQ